MFLLNQAGNRMRPVRQAFQPDSAVTENLPVRLERLTYETECFSPAKQLKEAFQPIGALLHFPESLH